MPLRFANSHLGQNSEQYFLQFVHESYYGINYRRKE